MTGNDVHKDRALFLRIAEGDEQAFEELFNLYVPQVHRIIYHLVPLETSIQDIAQEVFLHLWLGRGKLAEIEEPQHWIFRITYNQSFKYLRRQQRKEKSLALLSGQAEGGSYETATATMPDEAVDVSEVSRLIQQAIEELPEQPKRIYQLSRIDGMKAAAIAGELGISVQGVRNSLTRSGKLIKDYLSQHGINIPLILLLARVL